MDKEIIFQALADQQAPVLLDLLSRVYDQMTDEQRHVVFGLHGGKVLQLFADEEKQGSYEVDGELLREAVDEFKEASLAGAYWAAFNVNSKNYMQVPAETVEWLDRLAEMLGDTCVLTEQGDHALAVACFGPLFMLIDELDRGTEIVWFEERGSWRLDADKIRCWHAYMTSLAASATPEKFAQTVVALIRRRVWQSSDTQGYEAAIRAATPAQREQLDAELRLQNVHAGPSAGML